MKKKIAGSFLIVTVLAFGAASFLMARSLVLAKHRQSEPTPQEWLNNAPGNALAIEEQFDKKVTELIDNLRSQQLNLAELLEVPSVSNQTIQSQSSKVVTAHENLIRQVGKHIIQMKEQLPRNQKQRFMNMCAGSVRGPMCRMNRPRRNGFGRMRRGQGRGFRGGRGPGSHQGSGLAGRLGLSNQQLRMAKKYDPNFQPDIGQLRTDLLDRRQILLAAFENPDTSDDDLLQKIEELISASSRIEKRVTEYLLTLRPYLKDEQQKRLVGLCKGYGMSQ